MTPGVVEIAANFFQPQREGWLRERGVDASLHICAQCHGPVDGKEQRCSIDGVTVWLHPECQRFYLEGVYR
jgi:hypothetical protein